MIERERGKNSGRQHMIHDLQCYPNYSATSSSQLRCLLTSLGSPVGPEGYLKMTGEVAMTELASSLTSKHTCRRESMIKFWFFYILF